MPDASPQDVTAASAPPPAVPDASPQDVTAASAPPPGGAAVTLSWARFANERSAAYARAVEASERPAAAEAEGDHVDTSDVPFEEEVPEEVPEVPEEVPEVPDQVPEPEETMAEAPEEMLAEAPEEMLAEAKPPAESAAGGSSRSDRSSPRDCRGWAGEGGSVGGNGGGASGASPSGRGSSGSSAKRTPGSLAAAARILSAGRRRSGEGSVGKPSTTSLGGTFYSSFRENIDPSRGAAEPTREGERGVLRKLDLEILASETSAASPSGSPATPEPLEPSVAGGERIVPPTPADEEPVNMW